MPYEFMKVKGLPADHPGGGKHMVEFVDGNLLDYIYPLKERRGTSIARMIIDTANTIFDERRYDCGATSGGSRGQYLRLYITGAGGSGEALRVFTDVENVVGGAGGIHGAHISLKFGASGSSASGLAVANRCTLHLPTTALPGGGTYAVIMSEIWADGSASDAGAVGPGGLSYFLVNSGGDTTGMETVDDDAFLFDIQGHTIGSGQLVEAAASEAEYAHNIKIRVGGTEMYLMVASART